MKKLFASLLTLSLLLSLTACGGNGDPTDPDAPKPSQPETPELTFAVGTPLTHESTYTADDGTLLLHTNYELPQLELRTADGALYEPGAAATQSAAVAVRDAFNAEMERCYAAVLSNESELAQEARDHYGSDSMSFEYIYYEDELLGEVVYQTDGLISVLANAYAFYGGAHPNTSTLTWIFDLTTGEFLTLDALNAQSSTDSALGKTLVDTLASEIVNRIYEEGLDDYLYDDFYSYVYDLSSNAHFYFSGSGMTVNFDAYVLGPYASGPQTFEIPYSHFYNALDSHTVSARCAAGRDHHCGLLHHQNTLVVVQHDHPARGQRRARHHGGRSSPRPRHAGRREHARRAARAAVRARQRGACRRMARHRPLCGVRRRALRGVGRPRQRHHHRHRELSGRVERRCRRDHADHHPSGME